jgi:hydroxymethylbilane synthase
VPTLRAATRGSPLALWQTEHVASLLRALDPDLEVKAVVVDTQGDRRLDVPIWELGGKGVFAKEVQAAVLDGRADLAVHSAKDLPSLSVPGLVLASVPERGDPRDALVGSSLAALPEGAEVATGSLRRQAELRRHRPDLRFVSLRGNMQTRLAQVGAHDAIVVAATALDRLGLAHHIAERLEVDTMLPQVAQGALAVECREDDAALLSRLTAIQHEPTRRCVDAERAFLAALGGDCSLPAGAHAVAAGSGLRLEAFVAAIDGPSMLREAQEGPDHTVGTLVASRLLERGGDSLLGR